MDLVKMVDGEVFCDSSVVAKKFGQKHNKVVDIIENLIADMNKLRGSSTTPKAEIISKHYRGQTYDAYLMDRRFFSLLSMRFKGQKALEWQLKFNDAFYEMEHTILTHNLNKTDIQFLEARTRGKLARREETDIIKEFVDYATNQGSKSASFYYKHITNATYKALDLLVQKKPKLRDSMDFYQVSELILAERLAKVKLKEYMDFGMNYKDIYNKIKDDLTVFGNSIKLEDRANG